MSDATVGLNERLMVNADHPVEMPKHLLAIEPNAARSRQQTS